MLADEPDGSHGLASPSVIPPPRPCVGTPAPRRDSLSILVHDDSAAELIAQFAQFAQRGLLGTDIHDAAPLNLYQVHNPDRSAIGKPAWKHVDHRICRSELNDIRHVHFSFLRFGATAGLACLREAALLAADDVGATGRMRTPGRLSSRNSTPAASKAPTILATVSGSPPSGPSTDSSRQIVALPTLAASAN